MTPAFDVEVFRSHFPALASGTAFFDGPGGTQTPTVVAEAIREAMLGPLSNRGTVTAAESRAEELVAAGRHAGADLLGVDPDTVIFGRSATALHYIFSRALAKTWQPGDNIVVSRLDHDSNIRPWIQAAEQAGVQVRWADFDAETGELTSAHLVAVLTERTRHVAVTGASNLIGTRPNIPQLAAAAHDAGATISVDAVHLAAHAFVDLNALGADLVTCSPYKFHGPHMGMAAGRPEFLARMRPDKLAPSPDHVPERFEFGTLPYELLAGVAATVDFLASWGGDTGDRRERLRKAFAVIGDHEIELLGKLEAGLGELGNVINYSRATQRTPTVLVRFTDADAGDMHRHLAGENINAPASSFYALEASRHLGLGDNGGLRIGIAPYNTADEVERLLAGVQAYSVS